MTSEFGFGKYRFSGQMWTIFSAGIVSAFGFGLIFPFLAIYLVNEVGLGYALTGVVMMSYMLTGTIFMLAGGAWADKLGRKRIMTISLAAEAFTLIMYAFTSTFWGFVAIALAHGAVASLYYPAANAMVADIVPTSKRPFAYTLIRIAYNAGVVIGPTLGSIMILTMDIQLMFIMSGFIVAIAFLIILMKTKETLPKKVAKEFSYLDIKKVLHDSTFIFLCVLIIANGFAYSQFFSSLPVYATNDLEISMSLIALFFAVNGGMIVVLQIPITYQAVKIRRSSALAIGQALTGLGIGLIFLTTGFAEILIAVALLTFGELFFSAILFALVADLSPERMRGTYMGFTGLVFGVGEGIGMFTGLMLLDILPDRALLWIIVAMTSIPATIGFVALRRIVPDRVDRGIAQRHISGEELNGSTN